jgi:hypothetical protein
LRTEGLQICASARCNLTWVATPAQTYAQYPYEFHKSAQEQKNPRKALARLNFLLLLL